MSSRRRAWLIGALACAVLALATSMAVVATRVSGAPATGWAASAFGSATVRSGPGMMGGAVRWMSGTGFGLAGDGQAVASMEAAKVRAQAFADQVGGLHAGEVMQFSNGYYAELLTADGHGATEVLIDPGTGAVGIEYGPAMMWNTRYGMHSTAGAPEAVSGDQAVREAQQWLDTQPDDMRAGELDALPGYYTLHTLRGGKVVGMMSVNAATGAVWYHTWHGTFVGMIGD